MTEAQVSRALSYFFDHRDELTMLPTDARPAEPAVQPRRLSWEMERANIERALRQCNGQVYGENGAAVLLGMKPTTLWSRLRSLGISTEK